MLRLLYGIRRFKGSVAPEVPGDGPGADQAPLVQAVVLAYAASASSVHRHRIEIAAASAFYLILRLLCLLNDVALLLHPRLRDGLDFCQRRFVSFLLGPLREEASWRVLDILPNLSPSTRLQLFLFLNSCCSFLIQEPRAFKKRSPWPPRFLQSRLRDNHSFFHSLNLLDILILMCCILFDFLCLGHLFWLFDMRRFLFGFPRLAPSSTAVLRFQMILVLSGRLWSYFLCQAYLLLFGFSPGSVGLMLLLGRLGVQGLVGTVGQRPYVLDQIYHDGLYFRDSGFSLRFFVGRLVASIFSRDFVAAHLVALLGASASLARFV